MQKVEMGRNEQQVRVSERGVEGGKSEGHSKRKKVRGNKLVTTHFQTMKIHCTYM